MIGGADSVFFSILCFFIVRGKKEIRKENQILALSELANFVYIQKHQSVSPETWMMNMRSSLGE